MTDRPAPQDLVQDFLRAQNLEQVGRLDEAIGLYESIVAAEFDSAGPYDRLIWIYQSRALHRDVIRVATASLKSVRTYPEKRDWYQRQVEQAEQSLADTPNPRPR